MQAYALATRINVILSRRTNDKDAKNACNKKRQTNVHITNNRQIYDSFYLTNMLCYT